MAETIGLGIPIGKLKKSTGFILIYFEMRKKYKAVTEHLSCDLNGEAVVLNMKNGKYYGLNPVGSSIWSAIQDPLTLDDIKYAVLEEFEIDEVTCGKEVKLFLEEMTKEDLLEIIDEEDS